MSTYTMLRAFRNTPAYGQFVARLGYWCLDNTPMDETSRAKMREVFDLCGEMREADDAIAQQAMTMISGSYRNAFVAYWNAWVGGQLPPGVVGQMHAERDACAVAIAAMSPELTG